MSSIGIYVRVSSKGDRADDRFHSPTEQAERAEALVRAKGFAVGPLFEDINVSGATAPERRPEMGRLLEAIDRGKLGGVAAYSLDRLSRDPGHGDALVRRVHRAGGVVIAPDVPESLVNPTDEFTFGMLLQVAKLYRSQAKARFDGAKARATRAGIVAGVVPFGYRRRGEKGDERRIEIDPLDAPVVRRVFEMRAEGTGSAAILAMIDAHMDATGRVETSGRRKGEPRRWTRQGVALVVKNPLYMSGRLTRMIETGGVREIVESEVLAEAIVDAPLWYAAQSKVQERPSRSADSQWLLTGLAKCGSCGYNMHPQRNGKGYRSYVCRNRRCDAPRRAPAVKFEDDIRDLCFRLVGDTLTERGTAPDLEPLERALADAERRLEQVMSDEARDALGDLWAADVKARRLARDAAAGELGMAREEKPLPDRVVNLRETWDDMTVPERRAALGVYLIHHVEVRGSNRADWIIGFK